MKDFAGNELEVGQQVICLAAGRSTSWMTWCIVVGFTPQKVRVRISHGYGQSEISYRDPKNVVVPMVPGYGPPATAGSHDFPGEDFPLWD